MWDRDSSIAIEVGIRGKVWLEGLTFFADPTIFRSGMDSDFALCTARRMVRSSQIGVRDFHDDTARVLRNFILIKWSSRRG